MNLSRRLFLRQSVAATATITAVAAPVIAEAAQQEHSELLHMREVLPAAIAEFDAATCQREAARKAYAAIAPIVPDELILPRGVAPAGGWVSESERDCEGNTVWPEPQPPLNTQYPPRRIYSADAINRSRKCEEGPAASREHWTARRDRAAAYEAACEAARRTAGVDTALGRHYDAEDALRELAAKAKDIEPLSLTGLVIKAEVLMAYAACGTEAHRTALWLGETLPHQIVALFGRQA